ncbi:hypothetical protein PDE_07685 [Penicillium oxalicum 114-2]|uniref:Uncharacterized protein n=1 Tax=Penicillium oxalicum (strain 114-2 / CGMCC 5302) TaxID=933388 RepID=S7ZPT0_PENO1|nr:hypothetical protein PDE_07685 [Penicillium oxalicum 114-2]
MPRTLPWLVHHGNARQAPQDSTPRKRVKRERTPDDDTTPTRPPKTPEKRDFFRSSQTPPSSPARQCPPQVFLIEGLNHDDAWVMVEDEFYAVAQSYTQHLHYAEYIRRKKEAKTRSKDAIDGIQRPTDGRTALPQDIKRRKEAEALDVRQQAGLAQIEPSVQGRDDSDDDDDRFAGTHLHSLMASPRKSRSLVDAQGLKSATRAAAGYRQAAGAAGAEDRPVENHSVHRAAMDHVVDIDEETASETDDLNGETASDDDENDDDLDGLVSAANMAPVRHAPFSTAKARPHAWRKSQEPGQTTRVQQAALGTQAGSRFKSRIQSLFDDLDELPEPSESPSSSASRETANLPDINQVNTREPAKDTPRSKGSHFHNVPTFLL